MPSDGGKPSGIVGAADAGTSEPGVPAKAMTNRCVKTMASRRGRADDPEDEGHGVVLKEPNATRAVGAIRGLRLSRHPDELHSHEWIRIAFPAAETEQPLHGYEVRVSPEPIVDERRS